MSRPKFPIGTPLPGECIHRINQEQAAYDRDPEGYEARERQQREEYEREQQELYERERWEEERRAEMEDRAIESEMDEEERASSEPWINDLPF